VGTDALHAVGQQHFESPVRGHAKSDHAVCICPRGSCSATRHLLLMMPCRCSPACDTSTISSTCNPSASYQPLSAIISHYQPLSAAISLMSVRACVHEGAGRRGIFAANRYSRYIMEREIAADNSRAAWTPPGAARRPGRLPARPEERARWGLAPHPIGGADTPPIEGAARRQGRTCSTNLPSTVRLSKPSMPGGRQPVPASRRSL